MMQRLTPPAPVAWTLVVLVSILAALFACRAFAGALDDANAAYDRKDYRSALKSYRAAAEHGDAAAQNALGRMYEAGQGVPLDYPEALKWYRKAADQGYADAQANLGSLYEQGKGAPQDDGEAAKWYRKAAEQNNFIAENSLGALYARGHGVSRDDAEAARWYRKAAEQGFAPAQNNLGAMYAKGQGLPQDDAEAATWYRRAVLQGYGGAQVNLGLMYATGQGVRQDHAEALKLFRKAAEQGLAIAQYQVGLQYRQGEGVPQDDAEAAKWFRLAAEQGYDEAQLQIGNMYAAGQGVAKNEAEAARWYKIAASQGNAEAKKLAADEGPRLTLNLDTELREIMARPGAARPGLSDLRQCKIKGFHPGMTGKEYADNFFGQLTAEQKRQMNVKQPETLTMAACAATENFARFKQLSRGMQLYYNQPDSFVRFIYQDESYAACCTKPDATAVIPTVLSRVLFNADNAALERFAKDFSTAYKIDMTLFDDKSGQDAVSYRYVNEADGCQIDIRSDLSIHIKATAKTGTARPGAAR